MINTIYPSLCPIDSGSYCPIGTSHFNQYLCPNGSFSALSGLSNAQQCTPCSAGHYCNLTGLSTNSGSCRPGYFCGIGSDSATPNFKGFLLETSCVDSFKNSSNGVCPPGNIMKPYVFLIFISLPGHYCPANSFAPIPCPTGTNSSKQGLKSAGQCSLCPEGFYCPSSGTVLAVKLCTTGFYCPAGTSTPTKVCPVGSFCPQGSSFPSTCFAGTYQDELQQGNCRVSII